MANSSDNNIIACVDIGLSVPHLGCCSADDLSNPTCGKVFSAQEGVLQKGCQGNCVQDCQNAAVLYTSHIQDNLTGNGVGPVQRYAACVNLPSIARAASRGVLTGGFGATVRNFIPANTTDDSLRGITSTVTDCLSSTCRNSRQSGGCYDDYCSPVRLLANNTTPNITAIDRCLSKLCSSGYSALPYADADVVGIGVYISYVLQCIFLVVLWFGFLFSAIKKVMSSRRSRTSQSSKPLQSSKSKEIETHREAWTSLLLEFHKAQCYFSGTLMVASLTYGIYNTDMLVTFMLTPLATNGVLPIAFAYLLLVYFWGTSIGITVLTLVVYTLASIVYWSLYTHLAPVTGHTSDYAVYQQFMYKLSAIPACGGYSALAACPKNMKLGVQPVKRAGHRLRVLTPMIWTFSTAMLLALLGLQLFKRRRYRTPPKEGQVEQQSSSPERHSRPWRIVFWLSTIVFIAGMGMQLSLLAIATSLKMMNLSDWSFGQIVAVTIWIPPLLEYFYKEIERRADARKSRRDQGVVDQSEKHHSATPVKDNGHHTHGRTEPQINGNNVAM